MNSTDTKFVIPSTEAGGAYGVGLGLTRTIIRDNNLPVQRRANGREFLNIEGFQEFSRIVEKRTK